MGRDKARLELAGEPLALRTARLLATVCDRIWLVGGDPPPGTPGRIRPDVPGPRSALRGLVSALATSTASRVLVLATDMPFVERPLLERLLEPSAGAARIPRTRDGAHPLCGVYRRERVLPVARARLSAGELSLQQLLAVIDVDWLEGTELASVDRLGRALTNVNTPEQWRRARGSDTPDGVEGPGQALGEKR